MTLHKAHIYRKSGRAVLFPHRTRRMMAAQESNSRKPFPDSARIEELSDSDSEHHQQQYDVFLPPWLSPSYLERHQDELITKTSTVQAKTQAECTPFLQLDDTQGLPLNSHGLPQLRRQAHISFLHHHFDNLPAPFVAVDSSRPWFFYWVLQGLTALDQDVTQYKDRLINTLRPLQNQSGGFAGGHGQYSHSATTYACVLALTIVDGLDMIDRDAMWQFFGRMKQSDGGFRVADMAEEDIRGAYCAMTVITLLNLPLELPPDAPARQAGLSSFLDGLGEWIGRCQTYEGGIAGAPTFEAHGAYAFCALACLSIIDSPSRSIPQYLDIPALTRWMIDIQTTPEGGFAGRTNKLVDACYSHWVGGSWALLNAATQGSEHLSIWNRSALVRYLLTCCQQPDKRGGMRDKPSARPDAYHTCYSLAGLSAATHHYKLSETVDPLGDRERIAPFSWSTESLSQDERLGLMLDEQDVVNAIHPVFVIPFSAVEKAHQDFCNKPLGGYQT